MHNLIKPNIHTVEIILVIKMIIISFTPKMFPLLFGSPTYPKWQILLSVAIH